MAVERQVILAEKIYQHGELLQHLTFRRMAEAQPLAYDSIADELMHHAHSLLGLSIEIKELSQKHSRKEANAAKRRKQAGGRILAEAARNL
jgi:hypothetical protein